jgi:betaine-aldehyde dehydrogenase
MMVGKTYLNFIGGEWVPAVTGKTIEVINPANQEVIAHAQQSGERDMENAIAAARRAFAGSDWRENSGRRANALTAFAQLLADNKEALARLYTSNNGKTINEARGELDGCIDTLRYNAGMARNVFGRFVEPAPGAFSVIAREPVGVVGIITPWNWPVQLMLREMVPALAAGNAVVVKPASITAAISMAVIELLATVSDFPAGIVNVVTGPGQLIGEVIATSEQVNMISFTGDGSTGQRIAELAAKSVKKVVLELGGKSPNVLFADADLDKAIPAALKAAYLTSGQVCMAGTRLVVEESIFAEVVGRMKAATEKLKVGNGLDESCNLGPLASKSQLDAVMGYIEAGKKEGTLITGGYRLTGRDYDQGFFVAPTIFTDLDNNSQLVQEEIFGPVLVVQKFRTEAEAVEIANGTRFGLAAAIWTKDVNRAIRVAKAIKAGTVWVNTYFKLYNQTEFGGSKASGIGRTRGIDGLLEFTETKHINFDI